MRTWCGVICVLVAIYLNNASAQQPPRLTIPGAVLIQGARPSPLRPRIGGGGGDFPRPRRPSIPNAVPLPVREVRPVVEEEEDLPSPTSNFDNEVNKLGISALTSAVRQAEEEEPPLRPSPLPFRPEKPVPVTRDQIRERPSIENQPRPAPVPRPLPVLRPGPPPQRPVLRQERPIVRQEIDDEEENIPRQPIRKSRPQPPAQQFRPAPAQRPAPRPQNDDEEYPRKRKPVVQILRKYRTDNEDGSITWGFENDDGTFKEENLGIDCITRGKYGYVDPDGVRREYTYESGNKCDEQDPDEIEEEAIARLPPKKPLNIGKPQPQFRPPGPQYQ
ncbi:protein TsetseEP-like [Anoplophora glabripennis]|uniref:protein TsetseEP-like n=1 Tax=Anoplophora glabripennis TaxID=217634 RepID=UPI0008742425|nr:protein TsetseEP-like [Anoplophora glabripennis]